MRITLLGTGAAWPDADRNAPAFLVRQGNFPILIDCGGGTNHQLMKAGIPPSQLDVVLLTHLHIDHCVEFPSLVFGAYLTGKDGSFHVYGPPGTKHFTESIFKDTYDFAMPMMKKLRNKDISIITQELTSGFVFENAGVIVQAAPVEHGIPTLAFKLTAQGKSVVFGSDTAPCESLVKIATGADLLIAECSFPEQTGPKPGHCIPSQVGKIANDAKVKKLLLMHLFPPCKGKEDSIIADVKKVFDGPVEIGYDMQDIVLA